MLNNIHRTGQASHAKFEHKDRGAGVIVTLNVEGNGHYVIAGNSFRGLNFTLGGSALNHNGQLDEFYFQTAAREFKEECFGKLVELALQDTLLEFIQPWGLTEEQQSELIKSLNAISNTDTFGKLSSAVTEEKLKETTPVESDNSLAYKRLTYVSNPVDVKQDDLNIYLQNASKVANMLNSLFAQKLEAAKVAIAAERSIDPKTVPFNDIKKRVEDANPHLSDFTESKALGVIRMEDALAAIKFNHNIPVDFNTNTTKSEKVGQDGSKKASVRTTFDNGSGTEDLEVFGPSLKVIQGVIGSLSRLIVKPQEVATSTNFAAEVLEGKGRSSSLEI